MYKYVTGLVVGKFCPFHKGHELVLTTALEQCERVVVLSYTSEVYPKCTVYNRTKWLNDFARANGYSDRVIIRVLDPKLDKFPNDSAHGDVHRHFCSLYLVKVLDTTVQAVFTSEEYGEGFAKYLTNIFKTLLSDKVQEVEHIMVDFDRKAFPTSGTAQRYSLDTSNISRRVYASLIPKILLLGAESTGKTTITRAVADKKGWLYVPEYGRELYDLRKGNLQYEDMLVIGKRQLKAEYSAGLVYMNLIPAICDTSPLTTLLYCLEYFKRAPASLWGMAYDADTNYDKVFLCAPDFPMVQDGTRQDEQFREKMHNKYVYWLDSHEVPYTLLTGTLEDKVSKVMAESI